MKKLTHSKTFWVAVVQAVCGVTLVALSELDLVGYGMVVKSLGDILIRMMTSTEIVDI